jgi:hypothetical protein
VVPGAAVAYEPPAVETVVSTVVSEVAEPEPFETAPAAVAAEAEPAAEPFEAEPAVAMGFQPEPEVAPELQTAPSPGEAEEIVPEPIAAFEALDEPLLELIADPEPASAPALEATISTLVTETLELVTEPVAAWAPPTTVAEPRSSWTPGDVLATAKADEAVLELVDPSIATTDWSVAAAERARSLVRLERFLRQVQARRLQISHESVA